MLGGSDQFDTNLEQEILQVNDGQHGGPFVGQNKNAVKKNNKNKLENWKKRLIDFSKRNQLLYFKPRPTLSVELTEQSQEIFHKLVLDNKTLIMKDQVQVINTAEFEGVAGDLEDEPLDFGSEFESMDQGVDELGDDLIAANDIDSSLDMSQYLQTDKEEKALNQTLNKLRTRSKASLSEQGVNILYLALNFVKWFDKTAKEFAKSPLLLIPVSLDKKGLNGRYQLSMIDDEIRINPTLAYKLLRDYGIELPEYENKIEQFVDSLDEEEPDPLRGIKSYLQAVQDVIAKEQDWEILDESSLSLFSFAKLSLYKDLEENEEKILSHPLVRQICGERIDPKEFEYEPRYLVEPREIDSKIDSNQSSQILDADSSQQAAIYAAKGKESYVLQGPPGTGKSQTIANIVSESLAQNKKILFVSEKKAALDVVVNRLKKSNLDKYCFELHGSKQKKSDIIDSLRVTLEQIKSLAVHSQRAPYLEDMNPVKEEIQKGIDELHKVREPINKSLFEVYGELSRLENIEDISFTIRNLENLTEKEIVQLDFFFSQLEKKEEIINDYPNFMWRDASPNQLSFDLENQIKTNFFEFRNILAKLKDYANPIANKFFKRDISSIKEYKWLTEACQLAIDSPFPKREWFDFQKLEQVKQVTLVAKKDHSVVAEKKGILMSKYSESFFELDHQDLFNKFSNDYQGFMRFFNIDYWKNMSKIKKVALYNNVQGLNYIIQDLKEAVELEQQSKKVEGEESELAISLGNFYKKYDTNWEETINAISWVQKVLNKFGDNMEFMPALDASGNNMPLPSSLMSVVSESKDDDDFQEFRKQADQLISAWELVKFHLKFYKEIFPNPSLDLDNMSFEEISDHLECLSSNVAQIEDWIEFKQLRQKSETLGLRQFIDHLINNPSPDNSRSLKDKFLKKFYQAWVDKIELESSLMRKFSGKDQQLLIDKFKDLDFKQLDKVNSELAKKLALNWIEYAANPMNHDALQVLNSEVNKKKRHKPIRMLVKEIPELLLTLKPCWMMSPLSVSQLIDQKAIDFDIVIFDEASQIRTEDAICSIYRGKQLVLAGDTQQLPPTDFFNLSMEEDKDGDNYSDDFYESVLDECSVFLKNRTLNWHYRSQHESLISFSNQNFYDNNLVTFPAAIKYDENLGVHFEYVEDGCYERGSRYNRPESKRVAQAIIDHFTSRPGESLGVIAFSEAQQMSIERELASLLRKNNGLEKFFAEEAEEAFFIKNLENVQGDERDVIFFSIGYARDKKGSLSHNFGPLNRDGGHRRLNVAITRARKKLKVYSSINGTDIDPARTSAQGALLLKKYLAYAEACEQNNQDLASNILNESGEEDLDRLQSSAILELDQITNLEESIATHIEKEGYCIKKTVGTSVYKIDLAVYSKDNPDQFLLGIETDGLMYKSAHTARDRERLRSQVLNALGWSIHRVWARDWIRNPDEELSKILSKLKTSSFVQKKN